MTSDQHVTPKSRQLILVFFAILAGHFFLKALELSEFKLEGYYLESFFRLSTYSDKPWELLLPVNIGDNFYRYSTTGLVLIAIIQNAWEFAVDPASSMNATFLTLSSLLVLTTYLTAWKATRSSEFTITVTLGMAFGTQFNGLYANTSIMTLYLFCIFIEINLLFFYLLLTAEQAPRRIKVGFVLSLVCVALCWEMWLDYAVFLYAALALLYLINYKRKIKWHISQLHFVVIALSAILILYLAIKVNSSAGISEHFSRGKEGESVLNYLREPEDHTSVILVEDVISNLITYSYISFSNYLPPFLISSNALHYFGQRTTDYQFGYHQPANQFVYYHYVFYWYFLAGAFFVLFIMAVAKTIKSLIRDPDDEFSIVLLLTLSMILLGSFVHLFIKYRPYLSVPLLGYKCILSIMGVTLYLGFLMMQIRKKISGRKYTILISLLWIIIISGGFTRPQRLSELGVTVVHGTSQGGPNALKNIAAPFYFFFPSSEVTSAQKVDQWLNADGGVVDNSKITIRSDGSVIYKYEPHWTGEVSGKTIAWQNSITGLPTVWTAIE